jgi:hypothetical protein
MLALLQLLVRQLAYSARNQTMAWALDYHVVLQVAAIFTSAVLCHSERDKCLLQPQRRLKLCQCRPNRCRTSAECG